MCLHAKPAATGRRPLHPQACGLKLSAFMRLHMAGTVAMRTDANHHMEVRALGQPGPTAGPEPEPDDAEAGAPAHRAGSRSRSRGRSHSR